MTGFSNIGRASGFAGIGTDGQPEGDLTGSYPNPLVVGIWDNPVDPRLPNDGDTLIYNGGEWIPTPSPASTTIFQGIWDANANNPDIANYPGLSDGYVWLVGTSGNTNVGGITTWDLGDYAVYSGGNWYRLSNNAFGWRLAGNTGTNPTVNYIGTSDPHELSIRANAVEGLRIHTTGDITAAQNLSVINSIVANQNITGSNFKSIGNVAVNGGCISTTSTTFNLLNSNATTVNFAGGTSTGLNIGNSSATNNFYGKTKFPQGLSGSLTQLSDGTSYLVSGQNIEIVSSSNGPISISFSGALPVSSGGTGVTTIPSAGQLLIGNGTGFTVNNLSQGSGVSIVNGSGTVSISNTGVLTVGASSPISSSGGQNPTISLNNSGVSPGVYGTSSSVGTFSVTSQGLITSASNTPISINANQITSGVLPISRGGTNLTGSGPAGTILISDGTSWATLPVTGNITMTSGGITTVNSVQNVPVSSTTPVTNDILLYNGTSWTPSSIVSTLQTSYQTVIASEAIAAGDVCYIVNSGGSGVNPTVARAQANNISTIRGVIGLATAAIAKNATGTVQTYGQLPGPVDTHTFSQGAPLFVSTTTPGGVTDVKPEGPNFAFQIGIVTRQGQPQNVTTGIVFVSPIMQTDTHNLDNIIHTNAALNDVLLCTTVAQPAGGGNPALPPVYTSTQLTRLYYTNTPLSISANYQIPSSAFDTSGSKVIYLPISSGNTVVTLASPKPIVDLTSSDYGRQLWLHNVGNANITIPRAGGGNRNVALEGGISLIMTPGTVVKLMWINPGAGQAYWLQTDKAITAS